MFNTEDLLNKITKEGIDNYQIYTEITRANIGNLIGVLIGKS